MYIKIKQLIIGLLILCMSASVYAQTDAFYYNTNAHIGTYSEILTSSGGEAVDINTDPSAELDLGFDFEYFNTTYNTFSANKHGWASLGRTASQSGAGLSDSNNDLDDPNTGLVLAPLWDFFSDVNDFVIQREGTEPSRVFIAQWKDMTWPVTASGANVSFQIRIYEEGDSIQFIYDTDGTVDTDATRNASVGITTDELLDNRMWSLESFADGKQLFNMAESDTLATLPLDNQIISFAPGNVFTEQTDYVFDGVAFSTVDWADIDNDDDLDLLVTGLLQTGFRSTEVYENKLSTGEGFPENTSINLDPVYFGSSAFGDMDNDGDLDILVSGLNNSNLRVCRVYENNVAGGSGFTLRTDIGITGVGESSVAWADIDSDGDIDAIISGRDGSLIRRLEIWENQLNEGSTFSLLYELSGIYDGAIALGDMDNDGDPDLVATGLTTTRETYVYENRVLTDEGFVHRDDISLTGVDDSSVAWGDVDDDGDLDLLIAGFTGSIRETQVYLNGFDGGGTFSNSGFTIDGVGDAGIDLGDMDNDGDLDLLLTGFDGVNRLSLVYENQISESNGFVSRDFGLESISDGAVDWGDIDGDGDLDLALSGQGDALRLTKIYTNNLNNSFPTPGIPINLMATKVDDENEVQLTWDRPVNDTIFSYSLRIGTDSLDIDVRAPQSDTVTGYRMIPERGQVQSNSYTVKNFPSGTYFWSVQAINNTYNSSAYSEVLGFNFGPPDAPVNVGEAESPPGDENFYIHWEKSERATSYVYFIGQDTTDQGVLTDFVDNQVNISVEDTFAAVTLPEQRKYFYNVRAVNDFGQSDLSNVSTFDFATTSLSIYSNDSAFVKDQILFFNSADSALMSWGATYLRGSPIYDTILIDCSIPPESVFSEVRLYLSEDSLFSVDDTPLDTAIFESNQIKFQDIPDDIIPDSSYVFVRGDILELPNDLRFSLSIGPSGMLISGASLNDFEVIESSNYLAKPYNLVLSELSGITPLHSGGIAAADFDNDGDQDFAISGLDASGNFETSIYENQMDIGNGFVVKSDPVTTVGGSIKWSDIDGDNDMDLLVSGSSSSLALTVLVENTVNENGLFQTHNEVAGQINGESFFGDFDNDGDNDLIISGLNSASFATTQYFENDWVNSGQFIDVTASVGNLINMSSSSVDGADMDLDGDIDLVIAGINGTIGETIIYENQLDENGTFVQFQTLSLLNSNLSVRWGEFDDDGYPDIMVTGNNSSDSLAIVYKNDLQTGSSFIEDNSVDVYALGAISHIDFDHDGDPDFIATGTERTQLFENRLNIGGGFQEINIDLEDMSSSDALWIDVDNDADYDLILAGIDTSGVTVINGFENGLTVENVAPSIPENTMSELDTESGKFFLRWDPSFDDNTQESSISYNIYIGTSEMDDNIKPAEANLDNGYLLTAQEGSIKDTTWIVRDLPTDVYYWAVQAVDQARVGSGFSVVGSFPFGTPAIPDVFTILNDFEVTWTDSERADNYLLSVGTDTLATGELDMTTLIDGFDEIQVTDTTVIISHTQKDTLFYVVQAINDFGSSGLSDVGILDFNPELIKVEVNSIERSANVLVHGAIDIPVMSFKVSVASDNLVFDSLRLVANDTITEALQQAKLVKSTSEIYDNSEVSLISLGSFESDSLIFINFQDNLSSGDSYYYVLNTILDEPVNDSLYYNLASGDVIFEAGESSLTADVQSDTFLLERFFYLPVDTTIFSGERGNSAWADIDNDGDLDVVLSSINTLSEPKTQIYFNDNGLLTKSDTILTDINGAVAWADFDNDGDMDLLISGENASAEITALIFENQIDEDSGFKVQDIGITATSGGSVAIADFDNDGDMDFAISGSTSSSSETAVYENMLNEGGGFTEISVGFSAITSGEVSWGDMDNDGDADLLVTGIFGASEIMSIYENLWVDFQTFVLRNDIVLAGSIVTADWGDIDNDGDLDLLTSGAGTTSIYTNTLTGGTADYTVLGGTSFDPLEDGSARFIDADNDGDLDVIVSGRDGSGNNLTDIYSNESTVFTRQSIQNLIGVDFSNISLVDYNGDSDMDLLISGMDDGDNAVTFLYDNDLNFANTIPNAPDNLTVEVNNDEVTLSWNPATDDQTSSESLNYGLYLGSDPNRYVDVTVPANVTTGERLTVQRGSIQDTIITINDALPGVYLWSVQSVDAAYAGSDFATEETFTIQDTIAVDLIQNQNDNIYYSETNSVLDFKALPRGRSAIIDSMVVAYTGTFGLIENALLIVSEDSLLETESDNTFVGDAVAIENDSIRFEPNFLLRADTNYVFVTIKVVDFDSQGDDNLTFRLTNEQFYTQNSVTEDFDINNAVSVLVSEQSISSTISSPVIKGFDDQELASLHIKSVGGFTLDSIAYTLGVNGNQIFESMSLIKSVDSLLSTSDDNTTLTASIDFTSQFVSASSIVDIGLQDTASYILVGKVNDVVDLRSFTIQLNKSDVFINGGVISGDDMLLDSAINVVNNTFNERSDIVFQGLENSSMQLGDIDNDGDLDVLVAGWSGSNELFDIYENQISEGGLFLKRADLQITGVNYSSVDLGDVDNDGDLDILVSGESGFGVLETSVFINKLNTNSSFEQDVNIQLDDIRSGTVNWGDMDNDGDLDMLVSGNQSTSGVSRYTAIYENLLPAQFGFSQRDDIALDPMYIVDAEWADVDNDGDLDIIISGNTSTSNTAKIYNNRLNESLGFEERTDVTLTGASVGEISLADMDGDGDIDLLITGNSDSGASSDVYENTLGSTNTFDLRTDIELEGISFGSSDWADVDNDGDPDIVLTGRDINSDRISRIYENLLGDGMGFEYRTDLDFNSVDIGDSKLGDMDNDGDLDLIITGNNGAGQLATYYQNEIISGNNPPAVATALSSTVTKDLITFDWTSGSDDTTPDAGLSFALYLAEDDMGEIITSMYSDTTSGYRMVSRMGSINSNTWRIGTPRAGNYTWGVQSVDAGRAGSVFETESIIIPDTIAIAFNNEISNNVGELLVKGDTDKVLSGFEIDNTVITDLGMSIDYTLTSLDVQVENADFIASLRLFNSDDNILDVNTDRQVAEGTQTGSTFSFDAQDAITVQSTFYYLVANMETNVDSDTIKLLVSSSDIALNWANSEVLVPLTASDSLNYQEYQLNSNRFDFNQNIDIAKLDNMKEAWGDFDNDDDLDLAVTGNSSGTPTTVIYINNLGGDDTFSVHTTLNGDGGNSVSWGDMDGDGDLDLLVGNGTGNNSSLFENVDAGSSFTERTDISLNQSATSSDWGDFDNDGDLDIVISGNDGSNTITRLYENQMRDGTLFVERTDLGLIDVDGHTEFGDFDNDGDLDLFISGTGSVSGSLINNRAGIMENRLSDNGGFSELGTSTIALDDDYSTGNWGDMDNDGDLDLLIIATDASNNTQVAVFENNFSVSSDFSKRTDLNFNQGGYPIGGTWTDFDNDGDLDIAYKTSSFTVVRFYENRLDGSSEFVERLDLNIAFGSIPGIESGSMFFADIDRDSDQDLLLNGNNGSNIFAIENVVNVVNAAPSAPTALSSSVQELDVTLSWTAPTDDNTLSAALTYEIYIGAESSVESLRPAQSNITSGVRKIVKSGSVLGTTLNLTLPIGSYRWSVQAIDANRGSLFAAQETLLIPDDNPPVITNVQFNNVSDNSTDLVVTATVVDDVALGTGQLNFGTINQNFGSTVMMEATSNENEFTATVAAASLPATGVSFYVEFDDLFQNTGYSDTTSLAFTIVNDVSISGQVNFFGSSVVNYEMISLPFETISSSTVFEDLGPYDKKVWRLFSWNSISQQYEENPSTIRPGFGYWILAKDQVTVNVNNVQFVDSSPTNVAINPNWNLVGNPYDKPISIAELVQYNLDKGRIQQLEDMQFVAYSNGNFTGATTWNPYQGLFMFYGGGSGSILEIPAYFDNAGGRSADKSRNYVSEDEWTVNMEVLSGNYGYKLSGFGVHPESTPGEDRFDLRVPPLLWNAPAVRFNDDLGHLSSITRSIIPYTDDMSWDFEITAEKGEEITFNWELPGNLDRDLIVIEHEQLIPISMSSTNSITFKSSGANKFTVAYGDMSDFDLGNKSLVGQIYPNPIYNNFRLPVYMSEEGMLSLNVYAVDGTKIELTEKEYLTKGYHIISKEDFSKQLKPGVYVLETLVNGGRTAYDHQSIIIKY